MALDLGVSVVIPARNAERTIGTTLEALLAQTGLPRAPEILVVDNASVDGTRECVSRYPVGLLFEPRPGPSAARNRALYRAKGEIIAHLDADTVPTRRWLVELLEPFRDRRTVLAAGRCLSYPPTTAVERYIARHQFYDAATTASRPVLPFACSMNMAVRRDAALAISGWSEDMRTAEDVDFSTRLLDAFPGDIAYAEHAVLFHRNRDTEAGLRRQAWTYGEGAADMYRRAPEVLSWGTRQELCVLATTVWRTVRSGIYSGARRLGLVDAERRAMAVYHAMWTRWFWRGFYSFRRRQGRWDPWG